MDPTSFQHNNRVRSSGGSHPNYGGLSKIPSYGMTLRCGIPSVTLLGENEDWEQMMNKLDKIPQLGKEPTTFAALLRPVLDGFITSFNDPSSSEVANFWSRCTHETGGSGPRYLSGWITAFCFWDEEGQSLYHGHPTDRTAWKQSSHHQVGCELDGVLFHRVDTNEVPCGMASVPVRLNDNGNIYNTKIMAGMVGGQATFSGHTLDGTDDHIDPHPLPIGPNGELLPPEFIPAIPPEQGVLDSIQPVSGWWVYETECPELEESRNAEIKAIDDEVASLGDVLRSDRKKWARLMELLSRSEELAGF